MIYNIHLKTYMHAVVLFLGYLNLSINIGKGSGSCLIKSMCIYVIKASLNNVGPAGAMSRPPSWILLTIIFNKIS